MAMAPTTTCMRWAWALGLFNQMPPCGSEEQTLCATLEMVSRLKNRLRALFVACEKSDDKRTDNMLEEQSLLTRNKSGYAWI